MTPKEEGVLRIAGGQGFYGDAPGPLADVLTEEPDYVCLEALAELTLAILAKDRARDESLGYTRDLPLYLLQLLPALLDGRTRVITNAGGINPVGALAFLKQAAARFGLTGLTVALVTGDDLRGRPELLPPEWPAPAELAFASAYLGARPIVEALAGGAQLVITGRVADAALFLAPLVHEHGWGWDDADLLAAGTVVGHLLECSGQSTGGNHAGRWWDVPDPWRFGFPLADVGSRRDRDDLQAGGRGRRGQLRHRAPAAALRGRRPDRLPLAGRGGRHDQRAAGRPRRRPRARARRARPAGDGSLQGRGRDRATAGRRTSRSRSAGPTPPPRRWRPRDLARKRIAVAGLALEDWHVERFGVDALHGHAAAATAGLARDATTARRRSSCGWRGAPPTARPASRSRATSCPLALSGPPPGSTSATRSRPRASELLRILTTTVPRDPIDAGVRVQLEQL